MKQKNKSTEKKSKISRRKFIGGAAAGVAAFTIVPRHVLGGKGYIAPSEKLNIAGVGVGGMGRTNIANMALLEYPEDNPKGYLPDDGKRLGENIVALCDVDQAYSKGARDLFPRAKFYTDFRKMLDKQKDIDAIMIATPDHTHAAIAMAAIKAGKHVYVQKPLTYTVQEARMLTEAARKAGVATQMGNQGHSGEGIRLVCEWIWDGAIGDVIAADAWTNRPIWPQGMRRSTEAKPVPSTLDWDLWLGPAPYRPYSDIYLPLRWRGWWDFGTGSLGDMACHIMDPVFWALKLKYPDSVEACFSKLLHGEEDHAWWHPQDNEEMYPQASIVRYQFPRRGKMPPVKFNWYDGGLLPPRPDDLEPGRRMGSGGNGVIFTGTKGKIMCEAYGGSPRLIPEKAMKAYKRPEKTIPRIEGSHEYDWIRACKGQGKASSNFEYSGPFTETVLLGNVAMRFPGKKLDWDGENMKVTNIEKANRFIHREYRQGWTL